MSKIEWTEQTWNPIIGCSKISDGCKNCYAEKMAVRLACIENTQHYKHVVSNKWNGTTYFNIPALEKPLKRKKPTTYFVCSMGDIFHETVPFRWVDEVLDIIEKCPQHRFIILTKRAKRMHDYWTWVYEFNDTVPSKKQNIIWGITAENQEQANKRIPWLLEIPCSCKMVSIEPMLGEVDLTKIIDSDGDTIDCLNGKMYQKSCKVDKTFDIISWVIVGGESGSNARPMHPEWVKSIKDQCEKSNTPFFFKQWGEWKKVGECDNCKDSKYYDDRKCQILNISGGQGYHGELAYYMKKVGKKKAGCLIDGEEYKQFPKILQR